MSNAPSRPLGSYLPGPIIDLFRAQARTVRLPGTGRLAKRLIPISDEPDGSRGGVVPYRDGLLTVDLGSFIEWSVYVYGGYDVGSVRLLERLHLAADAVILDIGANVGVFTVPLAKRVPGGQVHAFEPHPGVRGRLIRNLTLNNLTNVSVNGVALGAESSSATLFGSRGNNQGWASMKPHEMLVAEGDPDRFEVEVQTVDSYCRSRSIGRVDLIKIDVEGAEFDVLRGAREVLERDKPVVYLEVEGDSMANHGVRPAQVLQLLDELGYWVWENRATDDQLNWDLHPLVVGPAELGSDYMAPNWLAIHPSEDGQWLAGQVIPDSLTC